MIAMKMMTAMTIIAVVAGNGSTANTDEGRMVYRTKNSPPSVPASMPWSLSAWWMLDGFPGVLGALK